MAWLSDDTPIKSYKVVRIEWEPTSSFDSPAEKLRKMQENEALASEVKRRYEISNRFLYPSHWYEYDEDGIITHMVFRFGSPCQPYPDIGSRQSMLARAQDRLKRVEREIEELKESIRRYPEEVVNAD